MIDIINNYTYIINIKMKRSDSNIQDAIKAEMSARGTEEIIVDVFKVRWTVVKSNRFDTKAFKATHAELYRQYTKETETRRFTVA